MRLMTRHLFPMEDKRCGLLDSLWVCQKEKGYISDEDVSALATELDVSEVEIEGVITFYHFFHRQPAGQFTIYLNTSITCMHKGHDRVLEAFERETEANLGSVDRTGTFGLFDTPCIGLNDHEPSALINFRPFTHLNALKVKSIIHQLKEGADIDAICDKVDDHIRYTPNGDRTLFFRPWRMGDAIRRLEQLTPKEVLSIMKESELSGRGGAFFPTWRKWDSCRNHESDTKFIICNADEGEPGTFKDRVLLHTQVYSMIEGMFLAGYTVGASWGVIYLRAEYYWLQDHIQQVIDKYREEGWLGQPMESLGGFSFDIRLQMGAGAYVCGEETALLESMEGKRGEPRTKWFFPVEKGYLQQPTIVNNVETFCAAARIVHEGVDEWLKRGIPGSPGTKLISVSGDVELPGIYEIEWGMTIAELLERSKADDPFFLQFSGPSGETLSMDEKYQRISTLRFTGKDIRCGGSFMVFNVQREIVDILLNFSRFFKHESCGVCTPCRAGNFIMERQLKRIREGVAISSDLDDIRDWGEIMRKSSRCGLGKTAPNSIIHSMTKFRGYFDKTIDNDTASLNRKFDLVAATEEYERFKE